LFLTKKISTEQFWTFATRSAHLSHPLCWYKRLPGKKAGNAVQAAVQKTQIIWAMLVTGEYYRARASKPGGARLSTAQAQREKK
jgi:hypothetical protein